MTLEIAFLLALLAAMVYCFMTEVLPVELTAFIGLLILIFTGMVETDEAFAGFSSPAVMTMFSIFFISGALLKTGVADSIGGKIHALVGAREVPLIILIMLVAGVLSAFMNNVAAAAVLLPAISSLARRSGLSPSRLFMPLSFGAILGGTTTLVGTPPNILASQMLEERGLEPFTLFDFTPMGLALLGVGILFMTTIGRRLLPKDVAQKSSGDSSQRLTRAYRLEDRLTSILIPAGSPLDGLELRQTRLGNALDVKVLAVERGAEQHQAPAPDFRLRGDDVILVDGPFDDLQEMLGVQGVAIAEVSAGHLDGASVAVQGAVLRLSRGSGLVGRTLSQLRFRARFGVLVVGVRRGEEVVRQRLAQEVLLAEDQVLVIGHYGQIQALEEQKAFEVLDSGLNIEELLQERLFSIQIQQGSTLANVTFRDSRLGELVGVTALGILRDGEVRLAVSSDELILVGDELILAGQPTQFLNLLELGDLKVQEKADSTSLESDEIGVSEAVVAPRSRAAGATLSELHFRDRFGLQVLALWRGGNAIYRDLASIPLQFGDALLLHGRRDKMRELAEDSDFVVLSVPQGELRDKKKAPVALAGLALMIGLVLSGLYPIHIAAFAGAVLCVLFGSLTMDEAYRAIEWRALFLVAAILPVGNAMESSGAAGFLADSVVAVAGSYGQYAFLAALAILASLLSQGLDGAPTVVILAPVVIRAAEQLDISPYPLMMVVGLAASAAFMTPFSHKANLLVMGAGGYKAMDYVKVGTPLTVIVLAILVLMVPVFFPL